MSETLRRVQTLVLSGEYLVSDHGFDELAEDAILPVEALEGIATAIAVEDYPHRARAVRVCWPCSMIGPAGRSTFSGEYRRENAVPPF